MSESTRDAALEVRNLDKHFRVKHAVQLANLAQHLSHISSRQAPANAQPVYDDPLLISEAAGLDSEVESSEDEVIAEEDEELGEHLTALWEADARTNDRVPTARTHEETYPHAGAPIGPCADVMEEDETVNLSEPSPSPYELSLNSAALNGTFSYAPSGQLTQGPPQRNLYTVGANLGIGVNIGQQFVLLPEGSFTYSHGSSDPSAGQPQSAESYSYRAGLVGTFSYADRTSSGPQTSSISVGAWISQEFGTVKGPASAGSPSGSFTTTTVIIGATFGFRRASLWGN